jgi:beta-phosphoglucomutase
MTQVRAVIFDLDGVLVTTDEQHYQAWKAIADGQGILFNREINHQLRGVSRMESLEVILQAANRTYTEDEKLRLADHKNQIYIQSLPSLGAKDLLPGVEGTLQRLKSMGIRTAIGSSSKNAGKILDQVCMNGKFDAVADGNMITHSKPHPEVFLKAAELLDLVPEQCVVVEDAAAGIEAAKRAGMLAVGIGAAADLPSADYAIVRLEQVCEIVAGNL